jgi:hypothetical protein
MQVFPDSFQEAKLPRRQTASNGDKHVADESQISCIPAMLEKHLSNVECSITVFIVMIFFRLLQLCSDFGLKKKQTSLK